MPTAAKVGQVAVALALPTSIVLLYWLYKRSSSDAEVYGMRKKVVTSRNTIIRVPVPQRAVGTVIGRQGANIKKIQKETGARLHFADNKEDNQENGDIKNHRVVVIHGTAETAQQAEMMVHQVIAELPEIVTEEIEVPQYAVGRLIGKGGVTVREMQRISGARIMIDASLESREASGPRIIILKGSRHQIDSALEMIQEKLEEEEAFRAEVSINAANRELRNKNKEQKEHIKMRAVQRNDEPWDMPADPLPFNQDRLPLKADYIEVYISAVEHPGHFWVQVVGMKALQLEQLQKDITTFVNTDEAKMNYRVTEVVPGELVAARFESEDSMFYRAKVVGETAEGQVDLYFVDFGDNAYVDRKDIFKLRSDFTSFPYQAIECQLAHVEPVGGSWSEEGITCFEDLTYCAQWKSLFARVVDYKHISSTQKMPILRLVDTSNQQDVDIGQELVKCGFAVNTDTASRNTQPSSKESSVAPNANPV